MHKEWEGGFDEEELRINLLIDLLKMDKDFLLEVFYKTAEEIIELEAKKFELEKK